MRLFSWLRQRIGTNDLARSARQRRSKEGRVPRVRPRLEFLEDRCVPSTLTVDHNWDNSAPPGTPAPQGTLEWAAANAQNGDTIVITGAAVNHGINLTHGEVILTQQGLTIATAAGKSPATISGGNLSRVFEVASGASVTMDDVTITGGAGVANNSATGASDGEGGGIVVDPGATLTLNGSTISNNVASDGGGMANFGTTTITGSTVSGNYTGSPGRGGGIANFAVLSVSGSTMSGNSATYGGAIDSEALTDAGFATLRVSGCMLTGNTAFSGGGIDIYGGTAVVDTSTLSCNSASYFGGGIWNAGTMLVSGCALTGNTAANFGGGIWSSVMLTLSNSSLAGNSAQYGGGLEIFLGVGTISDCTVSNNSASVAGGGIYNEIYGSLYVTDGSTVCGNTAPLGADLYNLNFVFISSDSDVCIIGP